MTRHLRIFHFSAWADQLEDAAAFLLRVIAMDLTAKVSDPNSAELMKMARLDCDWHAESTRVFASLKHPHLEFLPARVLGPRGLLELAKAHRPLHEEWWLIFDGQNPQKLAGCFEKLMPLLLRLGVRVAWYAFDEVSRSTTAFKELAPFLHILIHDELPLEPTARAALRRECQTVHRSWVANVLPFATPFNESPEEKIVFLGSKLGLTEHRQRQIHFLEKEFRDRFVPIHDHSVPVAERGALNRFKVSFCPEGRKFTTSPMGMTHTDRPFWSGCLGIVPVSEDSRNGGRLEALSDQGLIQRYAHADLDELRNACERALETTATERKRIYDYFNRYETVGAVTTSALHAAG